MKITGRFCLMALASLSFIFTPSLSLGQFGSRPQAPKAQDGEKKEEASEETKAKFATANPEDITNENFPDLIESFDYPNEVLASQF